MEPKDSRFWQYKVYADIRSGSQDLGLYVNFTDFTPAPGEGNNLIKLESKTVVL